MKLVLYHANCADGIFAAWILKDILAVSNIVYKAIAMSYTSPIPDLEDQEVMCVDFSLTKSQLEGKKLKSLVVIDHHPTALKELSDFKPDYPFSLIYDERESGATLVWKRCRGNMRQPWILPYIRDRDLWLWQLPQSKEISACVDSYPFSFENCRNLEVMGHEQCAVEGGSILRYQAKLIQKAVAQARMTEFEGYKVPIVNTSVLQSEIGAELCKNHPFAIMWWNKDKEKRFCYSLRSEVGKGINVGQLCEKFGGGGHYHAASFSCPWHMEQNPELEAAQNQIAELKNQISKIYAGDDW